MPESLLRGLDRFGIRMFHLWGMTETAPIATLGVIKSNLSHLSEDEKYKQRAKQGLPVPLVELRVMNARSRSRLGTELHLANWRCAGRGWRQITSMRRSLATAGPATAGFEPETWRILIRMATSKSWIAART